MIAHKFEFSIKKIDVFFQPSVVSNYWENIYSNRRCRTSAVLVQNAVEMWGFGTPAYIMKFIVCVTCLCGKSIRMLLGTAETQQSFTLSFSLW